MSSEDDLLILLMGVARLARTEAERRAREHGMTRAQWSCLKHIHHHPGLTQKELADLLEVEPITAARLVDRLEALGLIARRGDAHDRRVWRLHLRPAAVAQLAEIDRQRREITALITEGLTGADREAVLRGLRAMKTNLARGPDATAPGGQKTLEENA
jgi:DNA-binding MarR family transcriptional regulator